MVAPKLEVLSGDLSGRSYAVDDEEFVIGRSKSCHLVIPKRYVSREHARICREGGDYIVDGLSEKNPVRIGNRAIREHLLSDGDVFEFCGIKIRFRLPAGRQAPPKPKKAPAKDSWRDAPADDSWADPKEDSWQDAPARGGGADDSWADPKEDSWQDAPAPARGGGADDSWADPKEDSWQDDRGRGAPDEDSWGAPAQGDWDDEVSDDESWEENLTSRAKKRSGTHAVSRGSGIRFGDDGEDDPDEGTGEIDIDQLKRSSRGMEESSNEQTAELNAEPVARDLDDPDYDPFADVEATKAKTKDVDPQREKAVKLLSVLGFVGILLAVGIYMQVTKPQPWTKIVAEPPIRVAVGETIQWVEPWAGIDPPAGRMSPNLKGEPYYLEDGTVAKVEWAVPHIKGKAIFLVHGLQDGDAFFQLRFNKSRRIKEFQVIVEGDDPHDLARDKRREEFRKLPKAKLLKVLEQARSTAETYRLRRDRKESFYRLAWLEYAQAVDAAEALRGKGSSLSEQDIQKIEDAEQKARDDYDQFVEREFAIYKELVRKNEGTEEKVDQLRRVLRSISHACDTRYKRLKLILLEFYEDPLNPDGNEICEHDRVN